MAGERCPHCQASVVFKSTACWRCKAEFVSAKGDGAVQGSEPASPAPPPAKPPSPPARKAPPGYRRRWLLIGAAYGVLVRLAFVFLPGSFSGPMSVAFLVGTPLAVGAIAVYGADESITFKRAMAIPVLPMSMMLIGTAITLLEGSICIALMAPLFYALASLGGFFMGFAAHAFKSTKPTLGAFVALPLLLAPLDRAPPPDTFHEIRETVFIEAPAHIVWRNIVSAPDIQPQELPLSLTHLIGVPRPVNARNQQLPSGEVRFSQWEKGVHFTAQVVEQQAPSSITWRYQFAPDSFPKGSMDEHVVLGGKYLDLGDATFNLVPAANGTRLEVIGRYRLSTPINLYAVPLSRLLGHDFLRTLLGFYRLRAEQAAGRA